VNHTLDRKAGGAEQVLSALLSGLSSGDGFELQLAVPTADACGDEISPGVERHWLPPFPMTPVRSVANLTRMALSLLRANLSLAAVVRRLRPDVVYVNSIFALHFATLPALALGVPLVYHEHNLVSQRAGSVWHRAFPFLARRARRVVAISEAVAEELRGVGVSDSRIRVVHNAIDPPEPLSQRASRGPDERRLRVVQVANLHRWKGHATIIDAVSLAAPEGLHVTATFFGREQDAAFARELRRRAERLGVDDRVEFRGFVPDAAARLGDFDALVLASDSEPFGLAILEGMRAGIPVVASAAGGALEIIDDGESGLLFEPGNARALANCWRRLVDEPGLGEALARGARTALAQRFSPQAQIDGVRAAIEEALS
jgi:glycosyltransferase involved in cell wall biosynthesis